MGRCVNEGIIRLFAGPRGGNTRKTQHQSAGGKRPIRSDKGTKIGKRLDVVGRRGN